MLVLKELLKVKFMLTNCAKFLRTDYHNILKSLFSNPKDFCELGAHTKPKKRRERENNAINSGHYVRSAEEHCTHCTHSTQTNFIHF